MKDIDDIENRKIEHVMEILAKPSEDRTEKQLLELMSFTKKLQIFENIAMSEEHEQICRAMKLVRFNQNEVIVKQGDIGDSFFYILKGVVKIIVSKKLDYGIDSPNTNITSEKYISDLKAGQSFGELSLLYGTKRAATIVTVLESFLIKIDKMNFDNYVRDIFDNMLKDQIDFMKICPIFHGQTKDTLIELGIRSDRIKFITNETILNKKFKSDNLYIIRRGVVKVVKTIPFVKDESQVRRLKFSNKKDKLADEEKIIEILAKGPTKEDYEKKNVVFKEITLESMKMGDIFPAYFAVIGYTTENEFLNFIADSPCELIRIKKTDIQDIAKDVYQFLTKFAKPYPNDEFIRKFYIYNNIWINFKKTIKNNITADRVNKDLVRNNNMRQKFVKKKDLDAITLPPIFNNKSLKI